MPWSYPSAPNVAADSLTILPSNWKIGRICRWPLARLLGFTTLRLAAVVCLLAAIPIVMLAGCQDAGGPRRLPVFGKVDGPAGESLSGTISFNPAPGHAGPGASASLVNGQYRFDKTNGPLAGPHEVIVRRAMSKPIGPNRAAAAKSEWTLQAEVPSDGPYEIDFRLD